MSALGEDIADVTDVTDVTDGAVSSRRPPAAMRASDDDPGHRPNPFPGLRPFREDEEHLFFGRESRIDAMVDRLAETRFLAVVGSSGSGKSSLVNCGLRVALRSGLMASAGTAWRVVHLRPGGDPIGALARALAADGALFDDFRDEGLALRDIVETNLRMSRLGLVDVCAQARLPAGTNVLVVVDQFEELFRYRREAFVDRADGASPPVDESSVFVDLLLEAHRQTRHPIYVVLTMRSDFLGDCARLPGLAEAINAGQYLVPRMTRDERREAIAGPVAVSGATLLPVLLTRLLNDLGEDPDRLSILQHALNRLWAAREAEGGEGALNLRHYSAVGSMANALDRHLEQAFAELEGRERQLARKLFQALTDKTDDARGVRRPTAFATLCALCEAEPDELESVIDVFRAPGRSFLMPPADEPLEAGTVIDISHESLMRRWRRLQRWADEEVRSTQTYRRLGETASLHASGKAGLWRDPDLALALAWRREERPNAAWAARYGPGFERAMRFLERSAEAQEAERGKALEDERRAAELARARAVADEQKARIAAQDKAAKVQRGVTRVVVVALVVSLGLAFLAGLQTWSLKRAEAARQAAAAQTLEAHEVSRNIVGLLIDEQRKVGAGRLTSEVLSTAVAEESEKARTLWRLVERADAAARETPVTVAFVNPGKTPVRVLQWTPDVVERPLAVVDAGARVPVELFENDVWIARVVSSGRLVATGVVADENAGDGPTEVILNR